MRTSTLVLLLLVPLVVVSPAAAQEGGASGDVPDLACWRGRPLPDCRGFFLVEVQGSLPLWTTTRIEGRPGFQYERKSFDSQLDWNLGFMWNVSERWAAGGMLTLGTGSSTPLTGIKARVRRWLDPQLSVELGAGAVHTDLQGASTLDPLWGATADARLNVADRGSFFVRWDGVDVPARVFNNGETQPGAFDQAVYVGVGAGSTYAVASSAIGAAILLLVVSQVDWS